MKNNASILQTEHVSNILIGFQTIKASARKNLQHHSLNHLAAWIDQAVVSGASFLALVVLGRWAGPDQLGAYAIGMSVLTLLMSAQHSLITRPYSIRLDLAPGEPSQQAFNTLALSILFSAGAVFLLAASALTLSAFNDSHGLVKMAWALSLATPFVMLREYARKFAFAHLRMIDALIVDAVVAVVSFGLLFWLHWTDQLSAITAIITVGLSCAVGAFGWLFASRNAFTACLKLLTATMKSNWSMGKWFLSGQIAMQIQGYVVYWLTLAIVGVTATGVFTACMSIVAFANPILFGFFNVLTPKSVRVLRNEGATGLRRQAALDSLLLAALMGAFCILVVTVGSDVMEFLYPGPNFQGYGHILIVLALSAFAGAIGVPASVALASAEHARAVAGVMSAIALLNVILVWIFMTRWGLLGAAYAVLIVEAIGSLVHWLVFIALVQDKQAPTERVIVNEVQTNR